MEEALQRGTTKTASGSSAGRGTHDVLVDEGAHLVVTTSVFEVPLDKEPPVEDGVEAPIGTTQFDDTVMEGSQQVEHVELGDDIQVLGCAPSVVESYLALFLDGAIPDEIVEERFGEHVLQ